MTPNPAVPNPEPSSRSARRRRRKTGRRHRDLTPEEDNRRRQRRSIAVIIPAILAFVGGVVWVAGAWNQDSFQHHRGLIRTGQWFLGIGGGALGLILLRQWGRKLLEAIHERRHPPMDTSLHDHHHRRGRSRRRRHRSARPSAFRPE